MKIQKITDIRIAPSRAPWSPAGGSPQTLTLEGGEQFSMTDRHLNHVVPVVGDWLLTSDNGREIFQHYQIARTELRNGSSVFICDLSPTELNDGLRVSPAELNPFAGPVPQIGDYLIRKIDGYHVISRRAFEESHALVLGALKKRASDSFARSREQAKSKSNRRKSNRPRARARKARA